MNHQEISKKPRYNMNIIFQETGLKADTLRAWEKRYQLPVPIRTKGGHRLFSEYDLETVRWLLNRQQEGMRISQAVAYWYELLESNQDPLQFHSLAEKIAPQYPTYESGGQTLEKMCLNWLNFGLEYNESKAEQVLTQAFAQFPLETVCLELIIPGMAEIGERWFKGQITVQQEHFISELVSKKLQALQTSAPQPNHFQRILIGCPQGEFHTIPGLILNLLLRLRGWDVIYFGANIPFTQFADTIVATRPDLLVLTASRLDSSVELSIIAKFLLEHHIPLVYGGWIFNQIPEMAQHIPGGHLLPELKGAVSFIEELILNPIQIYPIPANQPDYRELISQLKHKLPDIRSMINNRISDSFNGFSSSEDLREGIDLLLDNILSALTFGGIQYLETDFLWVIKLLGTRNVPAELFPKFIDIIIGAIQENLDDSAAPVLDWMIQQMNNYKSVGEK